MNSPAPEPELPADRDPLAEKGSKPEPEPHAPVVSPAVQLAGPKSASLPANLLTAKNALRLVCATVPHLSGLAAAARLHVDSRIETAGVFASGRIVVNPEFLAEVGRMGAAFVLAHELMHLALDSHERSEGSDHVTFNYAHDYIINDMLAEDMHTGVPGGGLYLPGARKMSVEKILAWLKRNPRHAPQQCWSRGRGLARPTSDLGKALQDALKKAGKEIEELEHPEDVLDDALERRWFPETTPGEQQRRRQTLRRLAAKAASLGVFKDKMDQLQAKQGVLLTPEAPSPLQISLQRCYSPPWELALQRWLEAIAPGPRTFARPSRRGADHPDIVLPGRRREGWTLHIVLDTSGSMESEFPVCLGAIAAFSESVGIEQVHILQCDTDVTADEFIDPARLAGFRISGLGGSDMSPGMLRLAKDSQVENVIVLTDGYIDYPKERLPYETLWVIINGMSDFSPPYGRVLHLGTRG
jgi:predicted metal-dependent peptidase